jgi:glycosyltransferase involved in cell wall biosynthesis
MRFLFVHQNCPGQYVHYVRHLLARNGHEVFFLTAPNSNEIPGLRRVNYLPQAASTPGIHPDAVDFESSMIRARSAHDRALQLAGMGMQPDVIIGHNGWGEMLHMRDIWPETPSIAYFEFFYQTRGLDVDFDPEFPMAQDKRSQVRVKNAINLLGLEAATIGQTPTHFQRATYPAWAQDRIEVIPEGAALEVFCPDATASFALPAARRRWRAGAGRRVLTFVARNLEPYRGFHIMLRALPAILAATPDLDVVLVGGDGVSYGAACEAGSWKAHFLAEVGPGLDLRRVFFAGHLDYGQYRRLLQVSAAHVYLTYPFVASWSLREAMATGCAIIASDTDPVREFIAHDENGLLVPFHDTAALAAAVTRMLADAALAARLRGAARAFAMAHLDMARHLAAMDRLVERVTGLRP